MTSSETASAVRAFFESYRAAFERLDAAAIAEHFAYPSHITSDADEIALIPIADRQACLGAVEKVLTLPRQLGAPSGHIHDLSIAELSPRLVQVSLRMEVHNNAGQTLYDFEATYALAKIGGTWRIAAISHNQIPRLEACIVKAQSQA